MSLLSGLDDRSGNSGDDPAYKAGLCDHKNMDSCKNDRCADVSPKYSMVFLMDEMPGWVQKNYSN